MCSIPPKYLLLSSVFQSPGPDGSGGSPRSTLNNLLGAPALLIGVGFKLPGGGGLLVYQISAGSWFSSAGCPRQALGIRIWGQRYSAKFATPLIIRGYSLTTWQTTKIVVRSLLGPHAGCTRLEACSVKRPWPFPHVGVGSARAAISVRQEALA